MTSIEHLLARNLAGEAFTFHEIFQGLPGMAHGGSVLAAFDAIACQRGLTDAREIFGAYRRKVPLSTPLPLQVLSSGGRADFRLSDGRQLLVEGWVQSLSFPSERPDLPEDLGGGFPLPISNRCFACGAENPSGLQVTLRFDDLRVWAEYLPREPFRTAKGQLSTATLTTLLDETAFWLGALATGESGMTTEIGVGLRRDAVRFGERLIVVGERQRVTPWPDDPRYWETRTAVLTASGALLASGRIIFVPIRHAARRLITGMLSMNPPEVVRRVFPAYAR